MLSCGGEGGSISPSSGGGSPAIASAACLEAAGLICSGIGSALSACLEAAGLTCSDGGTGEIWDLGGDTEPCNPICFVAVSHRLSLIWDSGDGAIGGIGSAGDTGGSGICESG